MFRCLLDGNRLGCVRRVKSKGEGKQIAKNKVKHLMRGADRGDPMYPFDVSDPSSFFFSPQFFRFLSDVMVNRRPRTRQGWGSETNGQKMSQIQEWTKGSKKWTGGMRRSSTSATAASRPTRSLGTVFATIYGVWTATKAWEIWTIRRKRRIIEIRGGKKYYIFNKGFFCRHFFCHRESKQEVGSLTF